MCLGKGNLESKKRPPKKPHNIEEYFQTECAVANAEELMKLMLSVNRNIGMSQKRFKKLLYAENILMVRQGSTYCALLLGTQVICG